MVITDEEINQRIVESVASRKMNPSQVKKLAKSQKDRDLIKNDLLEHKARTFLKETIKIEEKKV